MAASPRPPSWAIGRTEFNACLRSFPFRKELGRPRMVVPTVAGQAGGQNNFDKQSVKHSITE